jgi:predicted Rossmann-fold nucleotide-binding protein
MSWPGSPLTAWARPASPFITGGGPGIIEAANRGARDVGAISVGLSIELPREQALSRYVDLPVHLRRFSVRKLMFVRYACAFLVFPGEIGTLDELFEALTLIQPGKIALLLRWDEPPEVRLAHAAQAMEACAVGGCSPIGAGLPGP